MIARLAFLLLLTIPCFSHQGYSAQHLSISKEILLWSAAEEGSDFFIATPDCKNNWNTGYRWGLNYRPPLQAWEIQTLYTRYETEEAKTSDIDLGYYTFDISIAYPDLPISRLSLTPSIGLRGVLLNVSSYEYMTGGLSCGILSSYRLSRNLSLFGKCLLSLFNFDDSDEECECSLLDLCDSARNVQVALGLSWDCYFVNFSAGYELQHLWDEETCRRHLISNSLSLHGAFLRGMVSF